MDTLEVIYARHSGQGKFNDKGTTHSYIPVYEELLAPYRETAKKIIEVGTYDGHSFLMWREYFSGCVYGIDIDIKPLGKVDLAPMILKSAGFIRLCDGADEVAVEYSFPKALYSWDVVIDDAAHTLDQQLKIYSIWKGRMVPGGIHIVEDLQNQEAIDAFKMLGFEIIDLRARKNRYDDVLAVKVNA